MTRGDLNALFSKANEFAIEKIIEVNEQQVKAYRTAIEQNQKEYSAKLEPLNKKIEELTIQVKSAREERDNAITKTTELSNDIKILRDKLLQMTQTKEQEIRKLEDRIASMQNHPDVIAANLKKEKEELDKIESERNARLQKVKLLESQMKGE